MAVRFREYTTCDRAVYSRARSASRTIFLFVPFTSVTLSCLRRFSIRGRSSCVVALIESYVGLDIWHRIRPIRTLCYCNYRDLWTWNEQGIYRLRMRIWKKLSKLQVDKQAQWYRIIYVCLLSTLAFPCYSRLFIFFYGIHSTVYIAQHNSFLFSLRVTKKNIVSILTIFVN